MLLMNILIFMLKTNYQTEKIIKEKVYNKIYKILPQDIICILQDNNIIKKKITNQKNFVILKII